MTDSNGLNKGRDLRKEAHDGLFDVLKSDDDISYRVIKFLGDWLGTVDGILHDYAGHKLPIRPDEPFLGVNDALEELNPSSLSTTAIIAILSGCFSVSSKLPNYEVFHQRSYDHLSATDPKRAEALLGGFQIENAQKWF